jgi:hypothetical protein
MDYVIIFLIIYVFIGLLIAIEITKDPYLSADYSILFSVCWLPIVIYTFMVFVAYCVYLVCWPLLSKIWK